MKILYLVSGIGSPAGWGTEFIQDLIFKLASNKVEATIIHPILKHTPKDWREWTHEQERLYKIKIVSLDSPGIIKANLMVHFFIVPFIVTIAAIKELLSNKYDLIHEFSSTPIILLRAGIFNLLGVRTVFTLSVLNTSFLGNFFWFKMFDFAQFYLIPSREIEEILFRKGIKKEKIIFSPPGLNLQKFTKLPNPVIAKRKLKIPTDKFIVSYFGPLTKEKGIEEILKAGKDLEKEASNIKMLLFTIWKGSREHNGYMKKIKLSKLSNLVVRHEFIDITALLSASDVVVLPYQTGFGTTIPPISVLEVAASGKPLITTKIVGVSEWAKNTNIRLVQPNDYPSLIKEIIDIYKKSVRTRPNLELAKLVDLDSSTNLHLTIYKKALL